MDTTMMITLLERLGWTSLQTALLVGLVALLCRALPSLSAATRCRLWWLVSLQAVLGLAWSQPLQLPWLPAAHTVAAGTVETVADAVYPVAPELSAQVLAAAPVADAGTAATAAPVAGWALALAALWVSGLLLAMWRTFAEWRRCRALLASAQPCDDAALVQALQLAADAHGLRQPPRLWTSDRIDAPQVIGPLRPVLLLPAGEHALQGDALDLALTHELQHLQRRDLQWGLLPALAQHLFFFHPLLRLAVREYAQAREEAVDAAVVAQHGASRHAYGRLLLQLGVAPQPHLGVASAAPSVTSLKRRLQSLQSRRACPKLLAAALTGVVLAVGIAPMRLVAAPVPPAPPAPPRAVAAVPAPPAPPAAPSAARPALPPTPAAPPRAPTAPAAPAAPASPQDLDEGHGVHTHSTMTIVTDGELHLGKAPAQAYVLVDNDHTFAAAGIDDLTQARQSAGKGPALWFRDGDTRYLVRDAALLKPLQRVYADAAALGRQQSALGARQGALGREQGELGRRQGELGRQQGQLALVRAQDAIRQANRAIDAKDINRDAAAEAARASHAGDLARGQTDADMAAQGREIARLASQQAELGSRQAALGSEQAVLGQRQARIHAQAAEQARQVIAQALASGKAERL